MKRTTTTILLTAAVAAGVFFTGRECGRRGGPGSGGTETRVDTLIVYDTVRDTVLVPVERRITRVDTVWLHAARDTVRIEAVVPIERKVYATHDYRAVVEGYRPELVEMELYRSTALISKETTRTLRRTDNTRWGVGIQAGYGITPKGPQPYLGVGVQYRLAVW